ncbi:hypothetical protein E1258_12010 [Micromonospora sp. KC207]|uniref:MEDS domain-containing protein n=1 Tax=Micromonospora sp. KC207 TaxID=2530377 RepID=UPI00104EED8C|nr:MEDS domain-containing protein [Micromonospora sp. KC207]TDC61261.1 hypothetical protein E1258_12010 [Micromonospora sp. KC207]
MGRQVSGGARPALPADHSCWRYDDPAAFEATARAFLTAGLAVGEELWYVTERAQAEARAGLAGELDRSVHDLLATALARAAPRPVCGRPVFEASRLRFVDHRSLLLLNEYAR